MDRNNVIMCKVAYRLGASDRKISRWEKLGGSKEVEQIMRSHRRSHIHVLLEHMCFDTSQDNINGQTLVEPFVSFYRVGLQDRIEAYQDDAVLEDFVRETLRSRAFNQTGDNL